MRPEVTDIRSIRRAILVREIAALKAECRAFDAGLRWARLGLWLRYDPDQPRAPAGSPDGGQWTSGGGSGGGATPDPDSGNESEWTTLARGVTADGARTETVGRADGTTIQSEYAASRAAGFDERHTVATPDGALRTFETEGLRQTVRDELGEVLDRSELTPNGTVLEPAAGQILAFPEAMKVTGAAAIALYAWMTSRNDTQNQTIATARSWGYEGGADIARVERMSRENVELACPRFSEVQSRTDLAAESVAPRRDDLSPTQYGTAVHTALKHQIDDLDDPNFRAEVSLLKSGEEHYGHEGTIRIDVFERVRHDTVCVYDIKTGARSMSLPRFDEIATRVNGAYGGIQRIVITEVRPTR